MTIVKRKGGMCKAWVVSYQLEATGYKWNAPEFLIHCRPMEMQYYYFFYLTLFTATDMSYEKALLKTLLIVEYFIRILTESIIIFSIPLGLPYWLGTSTIVFLLTAEGQV